jgi:UDP-perosamine 4-acetyltransferase
MRVVLYGSRPDGHAKVCLSTLEALGGWECAGFLDDIASNRGNRLGGLRVLGGRERLASLREEGIEGVVLAFGAARGRRALARVVRAAGLGLPTVVHPAASVAPTARLADGVVVLSGATIGEDVAVGEAALVNVGAILCHDVVVGSGASVGPGAVFAGRSHVGPGAEVGAGATLLPDVVVGENATVGAGAVVVQEVESGATVAGSPARPLHHGRPP